MAVKSELQYTKDHEWVSMEGDTATIGITDYAQDSLGDIVFINLPQVGDDVLAGDVVCDIESVKAVSDIYAPISGKVSAINEGLLDAPESVNSDPYGAWIFKLEGVADLEELMDAAAYEALIQEA
ncbi:glycine cleavage system protein GcvH [Eubacteriales bacterium OttesenSCG-928-M02]|nr:glycine cleavage system protein GcvH [Eubacteriales bacterium OttesenSCG-928-M02]